PSKVAKKQKRIPKLVSSAIRLYEWLQRYHGRGREEKSNDVSRNFVLNFPDRKVGLSIKAIWNGMVVFTPSITNSCRARFMRVITSSRDCPLTISFAIIES